MAQAAYTVEIDFETNTGSNAVFQDAGGTFSTFAATGTTGSYTNAQAFAASSTDTFAGDYSDVTRDVTSLTIRRGRDDTGGPFAPGECSLTLQRLAEPLDAPPGSGTRELYNPASTTSVLSPQYAGVGTKVEPGISPLRPLRVQMTVGATTRTLFYGYVVGWRYNRQTGEAQVVARDVTWRLSKIRPSFTQASGETTSSAIGRVLSEAGWSAPADRELNPTIQGVAAGVGDLLATDSLNPDGEARTGLELIDELLEVNNGVFYMRGQIARYENRTARSLRTSADFTVDDVALEYDPGFEVE